MVMNKKGIWRIMESVFAVLIIMGGIFAFYPANDEKQKQNLLEIAQPIVDEMAKNETLREKIVEDDSDSNEAELEIFNFIDDRIKTPLIKFNVTICGLNSPNCSSAPDVGEDIYSTERVISSTKDNSNSKIVKIYLWMR